MSNDILNFLVALWIAFQCGTHIERNLEKKRVAWATAYIAVCVIAIATGLYIVIRWIR